MKKRLRSRVLAVGMVGTSLLAAGSVLYVQSVRAQDKPPAGQLLERGAKLLEEKQYSDAKKVLLDIDPAQLPEDQRAKRDDLLKTADLELAKTAPTNETFDNAKAAQDAGQLAQAAKLYEIVKDSPTASADLKQNARIQLELVHATQQQKAPAMKALLQDAIAAYDAGRLDEAQNALYTIDTVGTETLDWKDASKPAKYERLIAEKRAALAAAPAAAAATPVAAATPAPAAMVSTDTTPPAAAPAPEAAPATMQVIAMPPMVISTDKTDMATKQPVTPAPAVAEAPVAQMAATEVSPPVAAAPAAPAPAPAPEVTPAPVAAAAPAPEAAPAPAPMSSASTPVATAAPVVAPAPTAATQPAVSTSDDLLSETINANIVAQQRARTIYETYKSRSIDATKAGNSQGGVDNALAARNQVEASRNLFSVTDYNALAADANNLVDSANRAAAEAKQKSDAESAKIANAEAIRLANQRREEKEKTINRLMGEAMTAANHQQYQQAAGILDQVLVIDPENNAAKYLRTAMNDKLQYTSWQKLHDRQSDETVKQGLLSKDEMIPYTQLMIYPEDWPELSRHRQVEATNGESDSNRKTREKLDADVDELSADQQGFEKVVKYLADKMGVNITVNWKALEGAGIDKNTQVSVNLKNVPFKKALATVLAEVGGGTANLGYTIDDGVVTISTKDELTSTRYQKVVVYDVRDLLVQPDSVTQPPSFDLSQVTKSGTTSGGSSAGGGGGGLFQDSGGGANNTNAKTRDDIVKEIETTIETTVAPDTWRDNGGPIGSMKELNGQLIVNQTVDNQIEVANLLQQLRETRAIQIAIEARLLLVSDNFLDDFGFGWGLTIPAGTLGPNAGSFSINNNSANLAVPQSTGVPDSLGNGALTSNALDISGQILDNWQLNLLLRATQADRRTTTVTSPRVTLFNGQRGYLAVTTQQNFVSNFNQTTSSGGVNGSAAVGTNLSISTLTTGVVLDVEATVDASRRYVVLKLKPALSSLDGIDTFVVGAPPTTTTTTTGSTGAGGTASSSTTSGSTSTSTSSAGGTIQSINELGGVFVQLPRITYTTVQTMVSVPDGGTLLVGGQKLVGESEIEVGVPVLSKIPGLNRLFTNRSYVKDERTLLILVRPKIIIQREEEFKAFGVNYDTGPSSLVTPGPAAEATPALGAH